MGRLTLRQMQLLLARREEAETRRDARAARLGIFTSRTKAGGEGISVEELWPSLAQPQDVSPEAVRARFEGFVKAMGGEVKIVESLED